MSAQALVVEKRKDKRHEKYKNRGNYEKTNHNTAK